MRYAISTLGCALLVMGTWSPATSQESRLAGMMDLHVHAAPDGRGPRALNVFLWCAGGWLFLSVAMSFIAGGNFLFTEPGRLRNAADAPRGRGCRVLLRAVRPLAARLR